MSEIEKLVKRLRAYPARSATGGKDPLSVGNVCALLEEAATAIAALKGAEGGRDAWMAQARAEEARANSRLELARAAYDTVVAERDAAVAALKLRDVERRQWALSELLIAKGYFNRRDLCATFGISVPQASIDIRTWLSRNHGAAVYNATTKRYERARAALASNSGGG